MRIPLVLVERLNVGELQILVMTLAVKTPMSTEEPVLRLFVGLHASAILWVRVTVRIASVELGRECAPKAGTVVGAGQDLSRLQS